jgi:CheY-like chemotaxis protein
MERRATPGMTEKKRKSVLMVEDDPNDVALFRRALRKLNLPAELIAVEDSDAAIRWLQTASGSPRPGTTAWPHLILLDIKMPRGSGWEVLEWLRGRAAGHWAPVIILSSSRESPDISRAYQMGVNSYLVKPVSFEQLKEMVRSLHHYWLEINERPENGG